MASNESGFTLLEVIIALAIMVIAFASILSVESNSINATIRAKDMNVVAMLARKRMIKLEYDVEGKTFEEVKKEENGTFEAPYQDFRWETKVKELKFPNLFGGIGKSGGEGDQGGGDSGGINQEVERVGKLVTNFFTKATREISVTVFWKRGKNEASYTVSTYWVDLNHEFQLNE